jgi:hypothetical protein
LAGAGTPAALVAARSALPGEVAVRQPIFCSAILYWKWRFYQDRLGTNIGKAALKKEERFLIEFDDVSSGALTLGEITTADAADEVDWDMSFLVQVITPLFEPFIF